MINRFGCRGPRLWIPVAYTGVLGWGCSTGDPAGAPAGVALEEISRLGCLECDTAELFGAVLGVASGPAGALAVLTAEEPHLRVAASHDDSLAAFGFSGEGPGELSSPLGLAITRDGELAAAGRHIDRFRMQGEHLERLTRGEDLKAGMSTLAIDASPNGQHDFNAASLRFDSDGRLWIRTFRGGESATVFDLFSPSLEYMGEVRVAERIDFFDIGPTTMTGVVAGPAGIPTVVVWRIRDERQF